MSGWWRRLHVRVALLVLALELLLLAGGGVAIYLLCRRDFVEDFDANLCADARVVTAEKDLCEVQPADPAPPGSPAPAPAPLRIRDAEIGERTIYAVWDLDGLLLARSHGYESRPSWAEGAAAAPRIGSLPLAAHERPYRGVYLEIGPEPEALARGAGRPVRVLFARSTRELEERLAHLRNALGLGLLVLLGLTAPLSGLLAWRALAPVRRLEREAGDIGEESIDARLDLSGLPGDLAPLGSAVNGMLDRLEAAFEREHRLAEDAAHELRTPVAGLKAAIQAALLSAPDAGEDRRALGGLLEDVVRLERLCEALLLTAAPASAAGPSRCAAAELGPRVAGAAAPFRAGAESTGGSLLLEVAAAPGGAPPVAADAIAVERITTNLVDNAVRHGGPGVRVRVAVLWGPGGASVSVEDDGAGVPPGKEARLFERFFRAAGDRSRASGGAGLGLAICRSLASAGGGTLDFERPAGRGCRFVWRIPFAGAAGGTGEE